MQGQRVKEDDVPRRADVLDDPQRVVVGEDLGQLALRQGVRPVVCRGLPKRRFIAGWVTGAWSIGLPLAPPRASAMPRGVYLEQGRGIKWR